MPHGTSQKGAQGLGAGMTRAEPTRTLTSREWQIIGLLARGLPNKRIAAALTKADGGPLAVRTVEAHIENIAGAIPNPEKIPARTHVMLWARDRSAA
jgi:DNA-binding NarL/FixJ family response regulator